MTTSIHDDADDILHWLNAHSVRISDGLPASLLQQKWQAGDREHPRLLEALDWLLKEQLIVVTPGLTPPHLRFSTLGFERLLAAFDAPRMPASAGAATAMPLVQPPAHAPAPPAPPPPPPPPAAHSVPANAKPPARFLDPGKPPTEIGLRNQVLHIYRDLGLKPGMPLVAMTLSRYWQEAGLRSSDLRPGIDVLLRDGYLQHIVQRYENHWALTEAGLAYLRAPLVPQPLLALAPVLTTILAAPPESELKAHAVGQFPEDSTAPQELAALELKWPHGRDALLHGLDLLIKAQLAVLHQDNPAMFALTQQGIAFRRESTGIWKRMVRSLVG